MLWSDIVTDEIEIIDIFQHFNLNTRQKLRAFFQSITFKENNRVTYEKLSSA